MRQDLLNIAQDIQLQARAEPGELQGISNWVSNVAGKVPLVQSLEKRLDIMQGLDPLMDGIIEKMNQVTDHSNLRQIQADDQLTKATEHLKAANAKLESTMAKAANDGLVVHAPQYYKTPKEVKINNKLKETWRKIEGQDLAPMDELHAKEAAKLSIANAAAAGIVAKDLTKPCQYEVHHNTVVDHNTPFYSSPAVVAHDSTLYKNQPVMYKNDAVVTSDYFPGMAVTGPRTVGLESTPIASTSAVAAPHAYVPSGIKLSDSSSSVEKSSTEGS